MNDFCIILSQIEVIVYDIYVLGEMDVDTNVVSKTPSRKVNDCHEIVKSSAVAGERRGNLCSVHQIGVRSVICFSSFTIITLC